MVMQYENPVIVLREGVTGVRSMDEDVMSSAAVLADRLAQLKRQNPIFEAVSFSPDVEAMLSATVSASNKEKCWNIIPMPSWRATAGDLTWTAWPCQKIDPESITVSFVSNPPWL